MKTTTIDICKLEPGMQIIVDGKPRIVPEVLHRVGFTRVVLLDPVVVIQGNHGATPVDVVVDRRCNYSDCAGWVPVGSQRCAWCKRVQ